MQCDNVKTFVEMYANPVGFAGGDEVVEWVNLNIKFVQDIGASVYIDRKGNPWVSVAKSLAPFIGVTPATVMSKAYKRGFVNEQDITILGGEDVMHTWGRTVDFPRRGLRCVSLYRCYAVLGMFPDSDNARPYLNWADDIIARTVSNKYDETRQLDTEQYSAFAPRVKGRKKRYSN